MDDTHVSNYSMREKDRIMAGFTKVPLTPALSTPVPDFVLPPPSLESSRRAREKNITLYFAGESVTVISIVTL